MIVASPGEEIPLCVVAPPEVVGDNKVIAVIKKSDGTEVASYELTRYGDTMMYCATGTAPTEPGIYAIDYKIVDANGNIVEELPEEGLYVKRNVVIEKLDEVLKWVKTRMC